MKGVLLQHKKLYHIAAVALVVASFFVMVSSPDSFAANLSMREGANSARGQEQVADVFGASGVFNTISNILLFVVGAISVIMIIIGGLRYVVSGGNSATVTAAKNTILYAVVGLIVALLGYAIVNFVLESFIPGAGSGGGTNV